MSITADLAEPDDIISLLRQSAEVDILDLNIHGLADYIFTSVDCVQIQMEREKASTILGNTVQVEDEIRRHMQDEGIFALIVENIILPHPDGCMAGAIKGQYFQPTYFSKTTRYEAIMAWFWQLEMAGVKVIRTNSLQESATAISSIYHNSQKLNHSTFKRYFKHITSWHPNPLIESLMGLKDAGLGEKKASALADVYGTSLYKAINAPVEELEMILGKAGMAKFIKAIGR